MTDAITIDPAAASYSTRNCRKCGTAMTPRADRERRVWECANCGRKER